MGLKKIGSSLDKSPKYKINPYQWNSFLIRFKSDSQGSQNKTLETLHPTSEQDLKIRY
jgi:hypothetical protein